MKPTDALRKNRVWSLNSKYFHHKNCSSAKRISKDNLVKGTAPDELVPHNCLDNIERFSLQNQLVAQTPNDMQQANAPSSNIKVSNFSNNNNDHSAMHLRDGNHSNTEISSNSIVNPYCKCNPCKCTTPCICGLRKRESTTTTRWDVENNLLEHTTKDIYRPEQGHSANSSGQEKQDSPVVHHASNSIKNSKVATAQKALSQLDISELKVDRFLSNYQASESNESHSHSTINSRKSQFNGYEIEILTNYEIYIDVTGHSGPSRHSA